MEKGNTWLTIIVPIYNGEKFLDKCLRSIASQSFDSFEVLLIDDGSTDESPEICKRLSLVDSRFRYYRIENSGALSARLKGMRLVRGRYFTFCDADDYYADKNVFKYLFNKVNEISEELSVIQFGYIKQYNHLRQTIHLVQHDCYIKQDTFNLQEYPKLLCSFWDPSHLSCNVWNKIYSSSLLSFLPTDNCERVFWGDDLILNLHLLQSIKGAFYLSNPLYVYRQSSGGTSRFSKHTMEDLDIIKKYQLEFVENRVADDCELLKNILFSEMAGWFLGFVKDAAHHLCDMELQELINSTLLLPRFKLAQQYYKDNPENWEAAMLLMKGDVNEYMEAAKRKSKKSLKIRFLNSMKTIYRHI